MSPLVHKLLLVLAFLLLTLAALGVKAPRGIDLLAAGLAFWVLSLLLL